MNGFTVFDYATGRPKTFPLPEAAPEADESQVGVVLGQDPPGDTEANPGDTVTLMVGQLAS